MIREEWQAKIVAQNAIDAQCLVSSVANRLYPELPMARDREAKLLEIPEMKRLAAVCADEAAKCRAELAEWRKSAA